MIIYYEDIKTKIGPLLVLVKDSQVVRIDYGTFADNIEKIEKWLKKYLGDVQFIQSPEKVSHVKEQLNEYFNKQRSTFNLDFKPFGTDFQKQVWQSLVNELPYGRTKTYKDIALAIGKPAAVRAVGGAINKNPLSIVIPCHRVIGMNGSLTGYNGGLDRKEYLLKHEEFLA
ncbi:methylated-DNA--[protein]-cysteine S-methyltransferase [Ornithinibacillus halotolerans]|uniref:Methylated-DNA--protein-cysteine methyltransferase n=1 Tax=Ornithinibacillus halotolerans TaxID=1274357 RepID=A0A916S6G8_9BACI|nr:methylated-DNA--[protein]-cysteine S-methyltransferase [Ornithinibacillus halotolerans]GGA85686.1 methylated-DNA--protein-cysteine methyltransferase [Ornithinibacillus halotolerans]